MNALPFDWSEQIQKAFPKRAGPSGWKGMRLMLAIRRALMDSTFQEVLSGCENYKTYCQVSGIEGSSFVQAPQRFIEDGSFLEEFTYQIPEDPRVAEHKRKESARWATALEAASRLGVDGVVAGAISLHPMQGECVAAFETRIRLAQDGAGRGRGGCPPDHASSGKGGGELSSRIARLSERMKANARN